MATKTKERTYILSRIVATDVRALHAPNCEHSAALAQAVTDRVVEVSEITSDALRGLEAVPAGAPYIDRMAGCVLREEE